MSIRTIVEPAVEPWTSAEMRARHRLPASITDGELDPMIMAARQWVESYLRRRLIDQEILLTLNQFYHPISAPMSGVKSIESIKYVDGAGTQQTMAPATYRLIKSEVPNLIAPAYGEVWPVARFDFDAIEITLKVGYGPAATDIHGAVRQAVSLLVGHFYEHRAAVLADLKTVTIPFGVTDMLDPHRFWV